MTDDERTPDEQEVIDVVADRKGEEWAEEHAELILDQAAVVGVIDRDGAE